MKKCIDCKGELDKEFFPYDKSRNRYLSVCKPCTSKRTQIYRLKNKDKWENYSKKSYTNYKKIINEWKSQGCSKCDEKRVWVIDAHHLDPNKKDFMVGSTMRGIKETKNELNKCIPLCSNCHRDLHYKESNK